MNEKIKELAKRAYEDVIANTPSFLVTKEMVDARFAELIIEECHQVIVVGGVDDLDGVKKHFEIE